MMKRQGNGTNEIERKPWSPLPAALDNEFLYGLSQPGRLRAIATTAANPSRVA